MTISLLPSSPKVFSFFAAAVLQLACQRVPGSGHVAEAGPITRPKGPLNRTDAERYVLALVNHDRAEAGLSAVEWDRDAARAGERHADDMAHRGYTAHWGSDGSVPEQRYTEAGGTHLVQENVACFFDGTTREVDPSPAFVPVELEKIETAFMSEVPPNDGHRKNILKKWHTKFGVGLSQPKGIPQPCMSQEFVDEYGDYGRLPAHAHPGETASIQGEVHAPVKFAGVGIARIDASRPMTPEQLNSTSIYAMPEPFVLYFPEGYVTPKPVRVNGNHFAIDVPLSDHARAGRYEVSVWGSFPGDPALVMLSLRVVDVR